MSLEKFYKYVVIVAPLGTSFLLAIIYIIFHFSDYPDYYEYAIAGYSAVCMLVFIVFSIKRICEYKFFSKLTLTKAINGVIRHNGIEKTYTLAHFILMDELNKTIGKDGLEAVPKIILEYCKALKTKNTDGHPLFGNTIINSDVGKAFVTYAETNSIHEFKSVSDDAKCFVNLLKGFFAYEKFDVVSESNDAKLTKKAGCKCDQTSVENMIDFILGVFDDLLVKCKVDEKPVEDFINDLFDNDNFYLRRLRSIQRSNNKYYNLGVNYVSMSDLFY